jgi:hypothetical protein
MWYTTPSQSSLAPAFSMCSRDKDAASTSGADRASDADDGQETVKTLELQLIAHLEALKVHLLTSDKATVGIANKSDSKWGCCAVGNLVYTCTGCIEVKPMCILHLSPTQTGNSQAYQENAALLHCMHCKKRHVLNQSRSCTSSNA